MKNVAIVTATRAEYGLLTNLIQEVENHQALNLQLFVTGAHLLESQGKTLTQIESRFKITQQIPVLEEQTNSDLDVALATGRVLSGFAQAFSVHKPDVVIVLGDRYELLGICSAALLSHIPIAHIHGGETTEGAMDEAIRHAVTKLSNLHFVAAEEYKNRVIQMGEQPENVYLVGSPGLDVINKMVFLNKQQLVSELGFELKKKIILITYHPVSWGSAMGKLVLNKLFQALDEIIKFDSEITMVWTASNVDAGGNTLNQLIQNWVKKHQDVHFVQSLGSQNYLSLMKISAVVLGNSSSGIIEAPALNVPTVNIGERQKGRLRATSIIDVGETKVAIVQAINKALTPEFKQQASQTTSLYGAGSAAEKMTKVLFNYLEAPAMLTKAFKDMGVKKS